MDAVAEAIEAVITGNDGPGYPLPYNSTSRALEASRVVKSSTGYLYGFTVYSNAAAAQFIQVHDASTLPSDGAVPVLVVTIAATSDREMLWLPPRAFHAGIVICNSTTAATKTLGAADCLFDAQYV